MPHVFWIVVLGAMVTGYLVLDGYAFGVGLLRQRLGRDDTERRVLLHAVGPYFLGNEVWVVAATGMLFGAFPEVEGALLSAFAPLVVLVVGGLIVRDAGVWLRSRRAGSGWRRGFDRLVAVGSAAAALGWGMVLGALVQGVPGAGMGAQDVVLFGPFGLLCGVTFTVLLALHGAVFVAMRVEGDLGARAAGTARRLVLPAALGIVVCVGFGIVDGAAGPGLERPGLVTAITLAALVPLTVLGVLLARDEAGSRYGLAFAATCAAVALPVVAIGAGIAPRVLDGLADPATLNLLAGFLGALLPIMMASQVWLWWAFRGRVDLSSSVYF